MKELAFRLKKGSDIKKEIVKRCVKNKIDTAIVLCGVGCVSKANIRLAKAINSLEVKEHFEVVSLTGTISKGQPHIHISLSDELGNVIGGHLNEGTIVNTTLEVVLGILEEYKSQRKKDIKTGYKEIEFEEIK